ncbi:MAG: BsuPI-related putative proteinase inhibitor [Gemmatimonadaceae bacterium]
MRTEDPSGQLASSLRVNVAREGKIDLALHVTNRSGGQLELRFPSGQTHEFLVLDPVGREIWRWSEGRMFTQALKTHLLNDGETVTYTEEWTAGVRPPGSYTAVATLRSTDHPIETRVDFTLP